MKLFRLLAIATLVSLQSLAFAQAALSAQTTGALTTAAPGPTVVIVKVPKPWYATKGLVAGKMRDTVAQYEKLPGLTYKAFSFAQTDAQYGGIYLWKDRASADNWFNAAWFERVEKERGAKGNVRMFDAPVVLDNLNGQAPSTPEADAVATVVTIPVPPGVTRERLVTEFKASVPLYQKVPGLLRKYFIITPDNQFGGVYIWASQASGQQWFNEAWHARVLKTYGKSATLEWFDTPILTPSKLAENSLPPTTP